MSADQVAVNQHGAPPIAAYTDIDDTDVTAGIRLLEDSGFDVRVIGSRDPSVIAEQAAEATVLVVGYAFVDAELINKLPNLRLIALMSMGFNNIDIEAADSRGIWVTNVPGAATEEVATHTLALILHQIRQFPFYTTAVGGGEWNSRADNPPIRISEATLGIIGLGKIGRNVAVLARSFFNEILGYDPLLPDDESTQTMLKMLGIRRVSLEELQRSSNVLSLHLPLTKETEGLIDADFIASMPSRAVLINVSRGALIDSQSLRDAVDSGHLAGAGLDVLDEEPPPADHPLVNHPAITVTPHVAYFSQTTEAEYVRIQAQNACTWLATGAPDSPVNTPKISN